MNEKLKKTKFKLIFDRIISDVPFFLVDYREQGCTLIRCMANGSNKKASKVALCIKAFYCDPEKAPGWLFSRPTK